MIVFKPFIYPLGSPSAVISISYWQTSLATTIFLIATSGEREQPTPIFIISSASKRSAIICAQRAALILPGPHCAAQTVQPFISPQTKSTPAIFAATGFSILLLTLFISTSMAPIMQIINLTSQKKNVCGRRAE